MVHLPDPQNCRKCGRKGKVVDCRLMEGFKKRRRRCPCGLAWNTYETRIDPKRLAEKCPPTTTSS